jgi:hypothetical protein
LAEDLLMKFRVVELVAFLSDDEKGRSWDDLGVTGRYLTKLFGDNVRYWLDF